jgi:hypothetical protein
MKNSDAVKRFEVLIYDNYSSLLEAIATKNIYIYCVLSKDIGGGGGGVDASVMSIYGFKRSCVTINNKEILTSYFSIKNAATSNDLFYYCFLDTIKDINKRMSISSPYRLVAIENITDNQLILDQINVYCRPFVRSPTAYFLYNYVCIPVKSNKCVIIL